MADQAGIDELTEKMAAERARLLAALAALSEEAAERAPRPGEWNAKQQMSHLAEMETTYRAWVERALQEDRPDVTSVRGQPVGIPLEEANRHTMAEHLAELRRERETTRRLVEALAPEQFDRVATHPLFGTLTVMQWLRSYYRHDRMHIDQLAGREPSYRPRFAGGSEPDQRTPRLGRGP